MTLHQKLLNASAHARSAAASTNPRMTEAQARRVVADIKRAQTELTAARAEANEQVRIAKERDRDDQRERAITAASRTRWLDLAGEVVGV